MADLLVSVRSAGEVRAALDGGAAVIDIKEPGRGPLGRAEVAVWRAVVAAVPPWVPVSVALGELAEWEGLEPPPADAWHGLASRKLGFARSGPDWAEGWARVRRVLGAGPGWVAVIYADWERAGAPDPDRVVDLALESGCAGILVDTWDKSRRSPLPRKSWAPRLDRARSGGLRIVLAGRLDEAKIRRLAPLRPDLFAVRGAACARGDRRGPVEVERVARLVRAARGVPV